VAARVLAIAEAPASAPPTPLDVDGFWGFVREHRDLL